jgi:hypothetical protein
MELAATAHAAVAPAPPNEPPPPLQPVGALLDEPLDEDDDGELDHGVDESSADCPPWALNQSCASLSRPNAIT